MDEIIKKVSEDLVGIAPVLTLSVAINLAAVIIINNLIKLVRDDRVAFHEIYTKGMADIKEITLTALSKGKK